MKRNINIFIILIALSFNMCLFKFSSVSASESNNDTENVSEFLDFEKAIIEINNENEYSYISSNQNVLSNDNEVEGSNNKNEDSMFSLKRLIVQGNIKNNYGASNVVSYNNLHVLCYDSEEKTQNAYNKLKGESSLEVIIDEKKELEEYAEKDYDYSSYDNWGAKAIDIGGYREFLVDNNVTKEVVVVVLDTGINTSHPLFKNRLLKDSNGKIKGFSYYNSEYQYSYNKLAFDVDDETTFDIDEGDENRYSFEDDNGHGAHVAGIICSLTPINVKILPVKIGGASGYSSTSIFISAYLRVINIYSKKYNIVATNLSYSGAGKDSEEEKETFNEQCYKPLMDLNILPITAAGNESTENNIEDLKAIVVSALKKQNDLYVFDKGYSNFGKIVDIAAPGTNILSAGIASSDGADSSIVSKDGTSMASPQVAAVVALLYLNPNLPSFFTALDIEEMLYEYALDLGSPGEDIYYGKGLLNIKYFEVQRSENLTFYRDGALVSNYIENENFEERFVLEIKSSNPQFTIIYTTDRTIPSIKNHIVYTSSIEIENSTTIYAMGVKIVNNEIIERTDLYNISYFNSSTPLEDCFTVSFRGYLDNYTGNYTNLVIPTTLHGQIIKGLEPSLFKDSNIESITLPETVTTIGGYVFQNAKNLKYIYAPNVTKIYISAFSNCESLKLVSDIHPINGETEGAYFPNLEETTGFAFSNCINLESVSLSKLKTMSDNGYDFQACYKLKYLYLPLITSIPEGTFNQCTSLDGEFVIGEFVETIGVNAFRNTKITKFTINKNNKNYYSDGMGIYSKSSIIDFARGNKNINYEILSSVMINGVKYSITTIEQSAMSYTKFDNLTIPSSITLINKWAIDNTEINILHYNAQNCSYSGYWDEENYMRAAVFYKINTIEIGANVKSVPERLFQDVYFDTLIINSKNTVLKRTSFYRMSEQGDLNKLVINFTDEVDDDYLTMLVYDTSLFAGSLSLNYLYSKTEIPVNSNNKLKVLTYSSNVGDYIVYSKEPLGKSYTITASSNGYGTVSPQGIIYVESGKSQTYLFTPNYGYHIESILIDDTYLNGDLLEEASKNGYTFTNVESNHTIKVTFAKNQYIISASLEGYGSITPKGDVVVGHGDSQKFEVQVAEGYHIENIYIGSRSLSKDEIKVVQREGYTFTNVTANNSIKVIVEINSYIIETIKEGEGEISPNGEIKIIQGESKHFTFTPSEGYEIVDILIDNIKLGKEALLEAINEGYIFNNIKNNHTIKVVFAPITHIITVIVEGKGTVNPGGNIVVDDKESQLFNFEADDGSYIKDVIVDGESIGILESYEFNNVSKDHEIKIIFEIRKYIISATLEGYGAITPKGDVIVNYGENQKFNIEVVDGYHVDSIYVGSRELKSQEIDEALNEGFTFENVTGNNSIKVIIKINEYIIKASTYGEGKISPSGIIRLSHGENKQFTFEANEGYEVIKVLVDGVEISEKELLVAINEGYTFEKIEKEHTIKAVFAKRLPRINVLIEGDGISSPNGIVRVNEYANKLFEFKANEGSYIGDVLVDGISIGAVDSYEFKNVNEDHKIKIIFKKQTFKVNVELFGNGDIECEKDLEKIEYGDSVIINIVPKKGYEIEKVWVDKALVDVEEGKLIIPNIIADRKVTIMFEKAKEDLQNDVKISIGGLSCSKNEKSKGNISDVLLVIITILGVAIPKKKFLKFK